MSRLAGRRPDPGRLLRPLRIVLAGFTATLVLLPVHLIALRTRHRWRKTIPVLWHRWIARSLSMRVNVYGDLHPVGDAGLLIASNHVSWLDIVAFGAVQPVSFIAKNEVRSWPLFGRLARWQECIFVARDVRTSVRDQAHEIADRINAGDTLVLFPEGTTSDGNFIYKFKSSLFGALGIGEDDGAARVVQPVAIAYTHWHGMPMGRFDRPLAAWPGDIELMPSLKRILQEGVIDVAVIFGEPVHVTRDMDRKKLTRIVEDSVRTLISDALRGRLPPSKTV